MSGKTQLIVVGVDGSDASIEALRWAATYAANVGGHLRAVKTWHYPWALQKVPNQIDESFEKQTESELEQVVKEANVGVEVECHVADGHASLVLVDESAKADLLVVGSRGHSAFGGLMLGSVSLHCVTHAACPVVVIRGNRD